jgi:hypothetical protein
VVVFAEPLVVYLSRAQIRVQKTDPKRVPKNGAVG